MCIMVPPVPIRNCNRPCREKARLPSVSINSDININVDVDNDDFTLISSDNAIFTVPSYHLFAAR